MYFAVSCTFSLSVVNFFCSCTIVGAHNLVNRLSRNGNGYHLYLKNTYKSTNQHRNSIQNAPTRTKLGKPKTDPTMVILAAFYILRTHICSALCLMPRDQFWRSNAFSPCQELPISCQRESNFTSAGCWHIHNQINTTTKCRHIQKKHISKKPIFLTLTITKKDGSNVHQAGPSVRRRTNVSVVLIILQSSYTINVGIGKFPQLYKPDPSNSKPCPQIISPKKHICKKMLRDMDRFK
jgi:hypothetical protein